MNESLVDWGSKTERYIITSVILLMAYCLFMIFYMAIEGKVITAEGFFSIITILLGYLFGYLPVKEQERNAMKKLEEVEKSLNEEIRKISSLKIERDILDESARKSDKALDDLRQEYEQKIIPNIIREMFEKSKR